MLFPDKLRASVIAIGRSIGMSANIYNVVHTNVAAVCLLRLSLELLKFNARLLTMFTSFLSSK